MKKKINRCKDPFTKVTEGFRQLKPAQLEAVLAKRQKLQIRLSETDKADIAATARWLQLTTTEYLLRLHYLAIEPLRKQMKESSSDKRRTS